MLAGRLKPVIDLLKAEGGKELFKGSLPGAVITAGLSTLTTGNPIAGLAIGAADLGLSFGASRALSGIKPLAGKYIHVARPEQLVGKKGQPLKQIRTAALKPQYEQSIPQTIGQLAGSVAAVTTLEPRFMPQPGSEAQYVTQAQQLGQQEMLNQMYMPYTADGTMYQLQGLPQRVV
jgi:hypothetical protein